MTEAPPSYEDFPALDGPNRNNNNTSHSAANIVTNNNINSSWSSPNSSANSTGQQSKLNYLLLSNTKQIQQIYQQQHQQQQQQQQQHQQPPQQPQQHQQQQNSQHHQQQQQKEHITQQQQQQQQQVLSHLVNQDHNSNAMVSQYHHQPQQSQQQSQQPQQSTTTTAITINNNTSTSNNNNQQANATHHNTMQNNFSTMQQRRPAMPNHVLSERCITFKIAPEERRHRDMEQPRILQDIMQKTNTKIDITTTKDGALNFCISGKEAYLQAAKNLVLNDFQAQVTLTVPVPKALHGRLLGPKGTRLTSIQDETLTKITIPRKDEDSDIIKIVGLKANAEQAVRSIQKYAREFAGKTVEKVSVERIYLLFITGPFNENLRRWEEMGAKVSTSGGIMPSNSDRESGNTDQVTFTIIGEASAVSQVKNEITQIYEDKKKKCTTVNMEVKKAQHKYILGPNGQNLRNLFAKTGVSVELPLESESETITLRGERSKLAPALSELYTQAHSETDEYLECEFWLHRYLIGPRKNKYIDFKASGVDARSVEDKIKLHGPPTEVENIRDMLESELETLRKTIIRKDIRVEPRIHGYIIGKAGTTVDQIREESGANVVVPKNDEPSEFISLDGTAEAVAIAEERINAIVKKYESSRKLVIDQQLHGSIIGRGGEKIRSIREKFSQVVFTFPEQGSRNNEITILGPADEVEECYKYLDEFHKQLQEVNHQAQVPIRKDVIKCLPDAQAAIRRIKADHKVKVDIFLENTDNQKGVPNKLQPQQAAASNESTSNNDNAAESTDGKNKKSKNKAKKQQQQTQASNGLSQKGSDDSKISENYAVVIGKKEDVDQAKVKLSKLFDELTTTTEFEMKISHKLRSYLSPKSRLYRQFVDEFQSKVVISFPPNKQSSEKQQADNKEAAGSDSGAVTNSTEVNGVSGGGNSNKKDSGNSAARIDIVKIRGPKAIAKKAEKRFEALIQECQEKLDKNFTAQVSVATAVIEKLLQSEKFKLNKIRETHGVKITLPEKRDVTQIQCTIVGYEKNVQAALKEFNKLVKDVKERTEEAIEIASAVHPRLIGAGGKAVKKFMEDFNVSVKFARQGDANPNSVTLAGRPSNVQSAKKQMLKLADQYLSSASVRANINGSEFNNSSTTSNNNNSQQQALEVNSSCNAE